MNTTKSVYNRLFKEEPTELASHEVQLAIINDIEAYAKGYDKYANESDGLVQKANRLKTELTDVVSAIFKMSDVGKSLAEDLTTLKLKFEEQAKGLGLDPKSSKVYVDSSSVYKKYWDKQLELQKIAKELNK
jgi:hypothetical protein